MLLVVFPIIHSYHYLLVHTLFHATNRKGNDPFAPVTRLLFPAVINHYKSSTSLRSQ